MFGESTIVQGSLLGLVLVPPRKPQLQKSKVLLKRENLSSSVSIKVSRLSQCSDIVSETTLTSRAYKTSTICSRFARSLAGYCLRVALRGSALGYPANFSKCAWCTVILGM